MKVLSVVQSLLEMCGGPSECVPRIALALKAAGAEVGIAYCDYKIGNLSSMSEEAFAAGVRRHAFAGRLSVVNPLDISLDFMRRLEDVAKDYDVVIVNVLWRFPTWWAAHVARKLGKPYVIMPHGGMLPNAMKHSRLSKAIIGTLDRYAMRKAVSVWATSPLEYESVKKYVPCAHVDIVPLGLDTSLYMTSKTKPHGDKVLLFLSRISEIKALDMLTEAWAEVIGSERAGSRGWKLVIAGPDQWGYLAKIKRFYLEHCPEGSYEFRDAVYGEDKLRLLRDATAFVLPSKSENWSVSITEAMASGLPVICTKGAPWGIIPEIGAGWRTEISVAGLKAALVALMSLSADALHEMGLKGRKWVVDNLDWNKVGVMMKEKLSQLAVK